MFPEQPDLDQAPAGMGERPFALILVQELSPAGS